MSRVPTAVLVRALGMIAKYGSPDTVLVRASKELRSEILACELAARPSGGAWVLTAKGRDFLAREGKEQP